MPDNLYKLTPTGLVAGPPPEIEGEQISKEEWFRHFENRNRCLTMSPDGTCYLIYKTMSPNSEIQSRYENLRRNGKSHSDAMIDIFSNSGEDDA